jgi:hypothetical protein
VPKDPERESPYRVMIEINQPGDANEDHTDQPSLVYSGEVDNKDPRTFQVLEIVGYPVAEEDDDGQTQWSLYFVDGSITTARAAGQRAASHLAIGHHGRAMRR